MHRTTLLNSQNTGRYVLPVKDVDVFTMLSKHYFKIELGSSDVNFVVFCKIYAFFVPFSAEIRKFCKYLVRVSVK